MKQERAWWSETRVVVEGSKENGQGDMLLQGNRWDARIVTGSLNGEREGGCGGWGGPLLPDLLSCPEPSENLKWNRGPSLELFLTHSGTLWNFLSVCV